MSNAISKAQLFVDKVKASGIFVSKASVFGSHARGKAKNYSDIDVCIVSPSFGKDYIKEMVMLRQISLTIDSRIEPIPLSPSDFSDPLGTLASQILTHSLPLK